MTNFNKNEILQSLAEFERDDDFIQAIKLIEELPEKALICPVIAVQIARLQMNQGDFKSAAAVLQNADFSSASAGEKLIKGLQELQTGIFLSALDTQMAERQAGELLGKTDKTGLSLVELARANHLYAQILLIGALYSSLPPEKKLQAQELLKKTVSDLESAKLADKAFSIRLSYIDSLTDLEMRIIELSKFAREAIASGYREKAGKAYCNQAQLMLQNAFPSEEIRQALSAAEENYTASEHCYGLIDVQCIRAKLEIERGQSAPETLIPFIEQYRAVKYIRGEQSVLMDIIQLFHENGNLDSALHFHDRLLELAEKSGFLIYRYNANLRLADIFTRRSMFSKAIELCEAAIQMPNMPLPITAAYRQLLGTAYSFVRNYKKSDSNFAAASEIFEKINMPDSASNVAVLQINNLDSMRDDEAWRQAENLLRGWLEKDEKRQAWELITRHYEQLAQIKLNRFSFSRTRKGDGALLEEAGEIMAKAENLLSKLPAREAALRKGSLHQMRGQLASAYGNTFDVIKEWNYAAEIFQSGGFELEAANCQYMIGVIFHNLANQQILPNALISQEALLKAIAYYEKAEMKIQSGDAHYLLASLYKNTIAILSQTSPEMGDELIPKTLEHIHASEADFDSARRDYYSYDVIEAQQGKQVITEKSARRYQLGLELYLRKTNDSQAAWNWIQRTKTRGLTDNLAGSFVQPEKLLTEIGKNSDALAAVRKEQELAARIRQAAAAQIPALRKELLNLHEKMFDEPLLKDYIELRTGAAVDADDLKEIFTEESENGKSCVFIDWVNSGKTLYLVCFRVGDEPQFIPLDIDLQKVRDFLQTHLSDASFRSTLRDDFELLDQLNPLISPLENLTEPEELLVLSPTEALFAIPLHALQIGGDSLLARNPVIYEPSLSVLRHCYARRRKMSEKPEFVIFGDPSKDRPEAFYAAEHLSRQYEARLFAGEDVTKTAFIEHSREKDVVHFQGHARFDSVNPVDSHLQLADGRMSVRNIFSELNLNAELVALTACESGMSEIKTGDEPLGLIPALIYAGSRSVLATLWRVNQKSAAEFTRLFYDKLYNSASKFDKARALREAVAELKECENFSAPYHWAGYVLYGDWR